MAESVRAHALEREGEKFLGSVVNDSAHGGAGGCGGHFSSRGESGIQPGLGSQLPGVP